MPRQNTGSYTQPANTTGGPAGATISSSAYNTLIGDIGAELTNSLDRRGRGPMLAALNAGGFPINGLAAPGLPTDAARLSDVTTGLQTSAPILGTPGGTANAITATFNPTITALVSGLKVIVRATAANTIPTVTFAADGTTAASVVKGLNSALEPGDIAGNGHYLELLYDTTFAAWILLNPALGSSSQFVGMIAPFGTTSNPAVGNWLLCAGGAFSRTTYAALFGAVGTLYGSGDGSTTFNVPNLQGYFIRAIDHDGTIDPGRTVGSAQGDQLHDHNHSFYILVDGNGWQTPNTGAQTTARLEGTTIYTSSPNGSAYGNETRPRNIAFNYYIKA